VLGNACNIDCPHCYQAKDGSNLLYPFEIGEALRRELMAFYPYLSTLRIQGGEVFAMRGFTELIDDVSRLVQRPILSVSSNGTLITEAWAERLVRARFSSVTISIDGGTRATYNRLRRGADLDCVLANVDRIQRWKAKLGTEMPYLDSFFVVMRSNFREIPQYLELMQQHGMVEVALQTMEISPQNIARVPNLEADEAIADLREVGELYAILRSSLPRFQNAFRTIRVSGLQTLFEKHGLSSDFLNEGANNLYPDSDDLGSAGFGLCPNPWTTLFVAENGDVHLCFISEPIGNLYSEPLCSLWNSSKAIAKRADMIHGRYLASGCSQQFCGWREGKCAPPPGAESREEWQELVNIRPEPQLEAVDSGSSLSLVRKRVSEERRRVRELEAHKRALEDLLQSGQRQIDHLEVQLRETEALLETGQGHIDHLEVRMRETEALLAAGQRHIDHLERKAEKAVADFRDLEAAFTRFRASPLIRAAYSLKKLVNRH
jgi:MoaA/NifB/PqqE/SkfB family radical SAM enzyme